MLHEVVLVFKRYKQVEVEADSRALAIGYAIAQEMTEEESVEDAAAYPIEDVPGGVPEFIFPLDLPENELEGLDPGDVIVDTELEMLGTAQEAVR